MKTFDGLFNLFSNEIELVSTTHLDNFVFVDIRLAD